MTNTGPIDNGILAALSEVFVGRRVRIVHTNPRHRDGAGVCVAFHRTETGMDVELADGSRYGVAPELTRGETWVEGDVRAWIGGRRRVELATGESEAGA